MMRLGGLAESNPIVSLTVWGLLMTLFVFMCVCVICVFCGLALVHSFGVKQRSHDEKQSDVRGCRSSAGMAAARHDKVLFLAAPILSFFTDCCLSLSI